MQELYCFIVFLCQYIHSFVFPEMAGRGSYSPPSHPPKSATASPYKNWWEFEKKIIFYVIKNALFEEDKKISSLKGSLRM